MKVALRNILYWLHRLVFDFILRKYKTVTVDFSDGDIMLIGKYAHENEMTFNQAVEVALRNYIKLQKRQSGVSVG